MDVLGVAPDAYTLEMARCLNEGVIALARGFSRLAHAPAEAAADADIARKAERRAEKLYRKALAALFQGDDYLDMFKRRETCSSAAKSTVICPMPQTGWLTVPIPFTTLS